jgi:hypothetical protein
MLASTVERDLAIDNNRHESITFCVLELHDLMTAASQLSPSARFLRILLDGFIFVALNTECGGFQMLSTCSADGCGSPAYANRSTGHQLRGDRLKGLGLYHWFTPC